jgi:amino acid permease
MIPAEPRFNFSAEVNEVMALRMMFGPAYKHAFGALIAFMIFAWFAALGAASAALTEDLFSGESLEKCFAATGGKVKKQKNK